MAWAEITRPDYARSNPRYASDLTDAEWLVIEAFMPVPNRLGRPCKRFPHIAPQVGG